MAVKEIKSGLPLNSCILPDSAMVRPCEKNSPKRIGKSIYGFVVCMEGVTRVLPAEN